MPTATSAIGVLTAHAFLQGPFDLVVGSDVVFATRLVESDWPDSVAITLFAALQVTSCFSFFRQNGRILSSDRPLLQTILALMEAGSKDCLFVCGVCLLSFLFESVC